MQKYWENEVFEQEEEMAVELKHLYADVQSEYDLKLLTTSCFGKKDRMGAYG